MALFTLNEKGDKKLSQLHYLYLTLYFIEICNYILLQLLQLHFRTSLKTTLTNVFG